MRLRQATPVLKEFGYQMEEWNTLIVQYGDGYNHIKQTIDLSIIESFNNQQELRKFLFDIYNNCVKSLKHRGSIFKIILPEVIR